MRNGAQYFPLLANVVSEKSWRESPRRETHSESNDVSEISEDNPAGEA